MDVELVSNVLTDPRDISQGQLLSHLPDRLTASQEQGNQEQAAHINRHSNQSGAVITKIEDIIESMADCILDGKKPLVIYLKSRRKRVKREDDEDEGDTEAMAIRFPSRKRKEAWRFSRLSIACRWLVLIGLQQLYFGFSNFLMRHSLLALLLRRGFVQFLAFIDFSFILGPCLAQDSTSDACLTSKSEAFKILCDKMLIKHFQRYLLPRSKFVHKTSYC